MIKIYQDVLNVLIVGGQCHRGMFSCVYGQCISAVRICESRMPGMLGKNSCWQGWFGAIWRSRYTSTEVVIIC